MGLTFFKGIKAGPFRFNLSGSGVGVSTGVRGFRIGAGPRGFYVSAAAGGFRYRTYLNPSRIVGRAPTQSRSGGILKSGGGGAIESSHSVQMTDIASADASILFDEDSSELLTELNERGSRISLVKVIIITVLLVAVSLIVWGYNYPEAKAPKLVAIFAVILSVFGFICAYFADLRRLHTVLMFDASEAFQTCYQSVLDTFQSAATCEEIHHARVQGVVSLEDRKYHAGATRELDLRRTTILFRTPPRITANVTPACLMAGGSELYFFPDRLLVRSEDRFGSVSFGNLHIEVGKAKTVVNSAPADGNVVGSTWRYVNKNGGPDKRFKNNSEMPIVEFSILLLRSDQGLSELFYFSRAGAADELKKSVDAFGNEIQNISPEAPNQVAPLPTDSATDPTVPLESSATVEQPTPEPPIAPEPTVAESQSKEETSAAIPEEQFYLGLKGKNFGLYHASEIREWIRTNKIQPGTVFWDAQAKQWLDMSQFPT